MREKIGMPHEEKIGMLVAAVKDDLWRRYHEGIGHKPRLPNKM